MSIFTIGGTAAISTPVFNDFGVGKSKVITFDAKSVEIQKSDTYIQWRYVGDAEWINLVSIADLRGVAPVKGVDYNDGVTPVKGVDYFDGTNGKNIELQVSGGYIQWRVVGGTYANLIATADLKGTDGITQDI